ncbi:hypothetical protein HDU97_007252 [Phlyctochytrium planicorne]|nr:hypothetical protein HDU97_007252 [Phlyctochytrium planicorne]
MHAFDPTVQEVEPTKTVEISYSTVEQEPFSSIAFVKTQLLLLRDSLAVVIFFLVAFYGLNVLFNLLSLQYPKFDRSLLPAITATVTKEVYILLISSPFKAILFGSILSTSESGFPEALRDGDGISRCRPQNCCLALSESSDAKN